MGLEGLRDSYFTSLFAAPLISAFWQFCFLCFCSRFSLEDYYMVTELSRYNLGFAFLKTLISRSYLINFLITGGFLWPARTVCYSQLNLTSDRFKLSDSMWFLCRFRYVESGSYRNLIDSFCQHFHGKHRNKNTWPKAELNLKYGNVSSMTMTETFQYTHYTSCHPPGVKRGFIKGEAIRLLGTNSSEKFAGISL